MAQEPRQNDRMLSRVERSYELSLFVGDNGMWTIIEVQKKQLLKAPSQQAAQEIINRLKKADGGEA